MISALVSTKRLAKFLTGHEVDQSIPWRTKSSTLQTRNTVLINTEYYVKNETKSSFDANESSTQLMIGHSANDGHTQTQTANNRNKEKSRLCRKVSSNSMCCAGDMCVNIRDGTFAWSVDEKVVPVLTGITITIPRDRLTLVVGPVGSGKTSLLAAIMGEMIKVSVVSYVKY